MNSVPNLRFKEFSGEWESQPLSKLGTFFKGTGLSKADLSDEGNPCVLYGELYTKYTEVIANVKSKTNVELGNAVIGKINDVLIPSSGETAVDIATASCLQQDDVILGGDLNVFRSNQVNGIFTSYQLNTSKKFEIAKLAQGASVVHVYNDQLKKLKLSVPTIEEQEKIASFFSLIDKKIELQTEKVEELKNYKKGIMQKIFSQELRFKDENGNEYPEWEEEKLGNICDYKNGKTYEEFICENGQYNLISLNSIGIDGKLKKEHKKVNVCDDFLIKGDLIMVLSDVAHGNFLGLTDIIPTDNIYVLNQRMGALRRKVDIDVEWLSKYINYNQRYFKLHGQGSSQLNLSKADILNFKVLIPCLKEQTKIAKVLWEIDIKIEKEQEKLEGLNNYKKGLLQQMFI